MRIIACARSIHCHRGGDEWIGPRIAGASQQQIFHEPDALCVARSAGELVVEAIQPGRPAEHGVEVGRSVGELIERLAQQRGRAGGSERDDDHGVVSAVGVRAYGVPEFR